ncbi:hypothetical protein [Novosphingobium jiangmenense]|uniref:Uncharacterized protein n=1 Tax=Novosphingobium jiangmenense TaxID=2791981 RepID=A0ABS0HCL5_9SPHN|nr:hypothetical protein [Novosphingobium jiangmenense]MBF9149664.1 hypothetical protein [Novosphingobium jiangmenense]
MAEDKEQKSTVIATFPNGEVTTADVDTALVRIGNTGGQSPAKLREQVKNSLIAAYAVEDRVTSGGRRPPSVVERQISEARRQILLDYYLGMQLEKPQPPEEAVNQAISSQPQLFAGRATFRFFQFIVVTKEPFQVAAAKREIDALRRVPGAPTIERINAFKSRLRQLAIPMAGQQVFRSSEAMPREMLGTLEDMARSRDYIRIQQGQAAFRMIVLLDRFADPVDPDEMRTQVAQGLANAQLQADRQRLIDELATTALRELRTKRKDDGQYVNVIGDVDKDVAARAAQGPDDGSVLNLFRSYGTQASIITGKGLTANVRIQRASAHLGILLVAAPFLLWVCTHWYVFVARRNQRRRSRSVPSTWTSRRYVVALAAGCGGASVLWMLGYAIPEIYNVLTFRTFATISGGSLLVGGALAYAWSSVSFDTHDDRVRALWPIPLLLPIMFAAAWFL